MKTTMEIPDDVLRAAKIRAAREGTTLRAIVTRALEAETARDSVDTSRAPWRKHFGALRQLHQETTVINAAIEEAFEQIDEGA